MKLKTHQATAKRLRVTKSKKILHTKTHQDHFNAREAGKKTRQKRRVANLNHVEHRKVKRLLPNSF